MDKPISKNTENKLKLSKLLRLLKKEEMMKRKLLDFKLLVTKKHVRLLKLNPNLNLIKSKQIH